DSQSPSRRPRRPCRPPDRRPGAGLHPRDRRSVDPDDRGPPLPRARCPPHADRRPVQHDERPRDLRPLRVRPPCPARAGRRDAGGVQPSRRLAHLPAVGRHLQAQLQEVPHGLPLDPRVLAVERGQPLQPADRPPARPCGRLLQRGARGLPRLPHRRRRRARPAGLRAVDQDLPPPRPRAEAVGAAQLLRRQPPARHDRSPHAQGDSRRSAVAHRDGWDRPPGHVVAVRRAPRGTRDQARALAGQATAGGPRLPVPLVGRAARIALGFRPDRLQRPAAARAQRRRAPPREAADQAAADPQDRQVPAPAPGL
ncbi:MAG: DNA polymerase III alpha subunit, partial [uncultured Solirubrobacteraceae bacterium]